MTYPDELRLNRRQWLLTTTAVLTGCGGGGNLAGALPGTGGTGIGVQGTITGFGSVIVNNTKFDDSAASVYLDGVQLSSSDLRVGMVASIEGSVASSGSSGSSGRASRIDVWSIARGVVRPTDITGTGFTMAGMRFSTDVATSFEGLVNLSSISVDTPLAVWGVQTSADARAWKATRVKLLSTVPTSIVSTGLLSTSTGMLNGMHLTGSALGGFADKQLLRVEGSFDSASSVLSVSSATAVGVAQQTASSGLVEWEGVVTAFSNATDFSIGTIRVDASKATLSPANQIVSLNSAVEVTGTLQNGVLNASLVEIKSSNAAVQIDITGVVEHFNGVAAFEVRGQPCDASNARVTGTLSNLHAGTKVRVLGSSDGDETLLVQAIYIDVP
jgi:hypothetical protein